MCECALLHPAINERYPQWPHTASEVSKYLAEIAKLRQFEWAPNGAPRANGSRQLLAPHASAGADGKPGGCEYCTNKDSTAVQVDGQTVPRCCQTPTRRFSRELLAMWQPERFGTAEWQRLWDRRNVVEGSYGIMKNRSILDWGRDFHHYVGLAHETIIATFAAVAYNFHMLRSWKARQQLVEPDPDDSYDPFRAQAPARHPSRSGRS